MHRPI